MPPARRLARAALAGTVLALALSAAAAAHTGLESSDPADGASVEGPLDVVELVFTGTPTALEDGIVVADASGSLISPVEIAQDGLRISARFTPPLTAGSYALTWVVRSDDTHTIDGSLAFTVVGASPIPATATVPASADAADVATEPLPVAAAPATDAEVEDGQAVARIGRLLFFPAVVVAVGMLAFAAWAVHGRRDEIDSLLRLVRWLGVFVAFGAIVEVIGLSEVFGGLGGLLGDEAGRAAAARVAAGVLLVVGFGTVGTVGAGGLARRSLSSAVAGDAAVLEADRGVAEGWRPAARDAAALAGVVLLLFSFGFDGHTASEGPRLVHAVASIVHVAAAAVWAGGLVGLAVVLWRRHQDGVASGATAMVLRFSVLAMASLAAAGAAGVVMAWFIQDDPGAYVSTSWGRLMLVKLALVLVAGGVGAYNHFRLLPALRAAPDDAALLAHTRSTVTVEAAIVVGVALVTALLVGASTL